MSTFAANMQLIIQQTVPGNTGVLRPIDNVLNYACQTPVFPANAVAFLTAWKTSLQALWLAAHDFSCILTSYIVKYLDQPLFAQYEEDPSAPGTYNSTPGAPAPSINAAFFFFKSGASGRSSHGGMHMGGLPAAGIVGNELTAGYLTVLNNWFTPFKAGFTDSVGNIWFPTILSRKQSSLTPPPPVVDVVALQLSATRSIIDKDVGTMRRRKERTAR